MSDASMPEEPVYSEENCTRCTELLTVDEAEVNEGLCDYCEHMTTKDD